MLQDMLLNV